MFRQKALAVALILILIFNILAVLGGEVLEIRDATSDPQYYPPEEGLKTPCTELSRGTRADHLNVDLVSRPLFGSAMDVHTVGNYAYLAAGYSLLIFDISSPSSPDLIGYYDTPNLANGVFVEDNYAYLANNYDGLTILDISTPSIPEKVFTVDFEGTAMDVFVSGSFAYVANLTGVKIINIAAPDNAYPVGNFSAGGAVNEVFVTGNFAYVPSAGEGLIIVNVTDPENPVEEGRYDLHINAEDVAVSEPYAYLADSSDGLVIVNIAMKNDPQFESNQPTNGSPVEVKLHGSYTYLADGDGGLAIIDVSEPTSPVALDSFQTKSSVNSVHIENGYAFLSDDLYGLRIIDLGGEPPVPAEVGWWEETGGTAEDVFIEGNYAYIADGTAGLRIIDISDPYSPVQVGINDTEGRAQGITLKGGHAFIADNTGGLVVVDVSTPSNPSYQWSVDTDGTTYEVDVSDTHAFIADGTNGLRIIDLATHQEDAFYPTDNSFVAVQVDYPFAYVMESGMDGGLVIINITDPLDPQMENRTTGITLWPDLYISGSYAFVTNYFGGFGIFDINDPQNLQIVSSYFDISYFTSGIYSLGTTVYLASSNGLVVIDITNIHNPQEIGFYNTSGNGNKVYVADQFAYLADWRAGLYVLDINQVMDAIPPQILSVFPIDSSDSVSLDTQIHVNFSENMDHDSVESAYLITPSVVGAFSWSGDSIIFTPSSLLSPGTTYEVKIIASAMDTAGNTLDGNGNGNSEGSPTDDYSFQFTTAIPPQIEAVIPDVDSINVPTDIQITINFTNPMNTVSVENVFSISGGQQIWTASEGSVAWANQDKSFGFIPSPSFESGVLYNINILYSAMDKTGNLLDTDGDGIPGEINEDNYTWSFTTIPLPPVVESTYPADGSTLILTNTSVIINFSKSMNKEDTLAALEYTDGSSTVSPSGGQVVWTNNNMTLTFTPTSFFANEKTFTFTVRSTARDEEGAALDADGDGIGGEEGEDDYSFSFTTMHLPAKVLQITPNKKATMVDVNTDIVIRFSRSMDSSSVEAAFSYTHENTTTNWKANDGDVQWNPDSKIMTFTPDELLEHDRVYTVTILAFAEDTLGVTLDGDKDKLPEGEGIDDYTWDFTTVKEPPEVLSLEPGNNTLDVLLNTEMKIRFDRSMDTRSVEKAFSFTHSGTSETWEIFDGSAVWTEDSSVFTFTPDFRLDEGMVYTVTIDDSAEDEDGVPFPGLEWQFTTKINSPPLLENGGVNPDPGTTDDQFTFSIVYTDSDDDEAMEKILVIDQVKWRMYSGDPTDKTYTDGKVYEFIIELDEGEHEYYFEFSDGRNNERFPEGSANRKLQVTAAKEEGGGMGFIEEEYAGVPGMLCFSLGIIIIIVIVVTVMMITRKGKRAKRMEEAAQSFQTFDDSGGAPMTFSLPGDEPVMSFAPIGEAPAMSFTTFEEAPPSLDAAQPTVVQCPDCGEYLRVRAAHRPFEFPCKCGARLVLK